MVSLYTVETPPERQTQGQTGSASGVCVMSQEVVLEVLVMAAAVVVVGVIPAALTPNSHPH